MKIKRPQAKKLWKLLAANVRWYRDSYNWDEPTLAKKAGLHRVTIYYIERARYGSSLEVIAQLAKAFKVPAYQLLK
jgi:DNA-binding XRE family transcriptional regulator